VADGGRGTERAGGRWIDVAPGRLAGWLDTFAQRHGQPAVLPGPAVITFSAPDGAVARCHVPFPPLPDAASAGAQQIAEHALADRTVGVLLVRLGGYAAGVFTGPGAQLAASKVGSRLVHGRSAAGGTSQHRFARRREKQAAEALAAAADTAVAVLGPYAARLSAVVLGGDRRAIAGLREDVRLAPYFGLAVERFLTVPDPRLAVLRGAPALFRAVRIQLTDPPAA
jgi:Actinobacteria/chloroflexi VLRF1 release factor